jgi:tyrosine-protein kinase Etk/Wzc
VVTERQEPEDSPESSLLKRIVVLVEHRRLIVGGMLICALLTAVIALVMPVNYTASTVILTPQTTSGSASALLGELGSMGALASLAGDGQFKSQSDTYLGVLNSRTVSDSLIQTFHLRDVYRNRTMVDTRKALARHTHIETNRGAFITITVDDHDVHRAAALANGYVEELYRVNQRLALTTGAQRRLFLEQQVDAERGPLGKAEDAFQEIQQKTGVIQLAGQEEMTLRSIAQIRAAISAREVQLESMRTTTTEQNIDMQRAESALAALREQLKKAESGSGATDDDSYFVSASRIPRDGLEYLRRMRDLRYHEALFEMLSRQYEAARIDEAKAPPLIQVLDKAIVLDKRSWPPRRLLVMLATLTSGILLSAAVLLKGRLAQIAAEPANAPHLDALRRTIRPSNRSA